MVEAFGKACHSSLISEGINAINIIARLVTFIEDKQNDFNLTSNCGVISGGDIVNRVPDYCSLKFDIRSTNSNNVKNFINIINEKIKNLKNFYGCEISIKKSLEIPPLEIKNENVIKGLADAINVKINKFMGGCEAGYYQALSGDALIFGVGDISLAHKPNEYVNIKEYIKYSKKLMELINKIQQKYYT